MKRFTISGLAFILVAGGLFSRPIYTFGLESNNFAAKKVLSETTSENWAGYAASGNGFTEVNGSWTIPTIKPSQVLATDAAWVGIGGVNNSDLIQSGTQGVTINGQVQYQAWTEVLPAVSKPLAINVSPGDNISVNITEKSLNKWRITFTDVTSGQTITKDISYNSSHSSAEWIEEAPSDSNGVLPLDNFGKITFSNSYAIRNGKQESLTASKAKAITLVSNSGTLLASTSALSSDGSSFNVSRSNNKQTIPKNRIFKPMETWTHKVHRSK